MPSVATISGPVDLGDLGLTLIHEHLRTTYESVRTQFPHLYDEAEEERRAIEEVRRAMEHGVRTIADPACMDLGRDVRLAQRVAEATGIRVVMATGIYGMHYRMLPHVFQTRDVDFLADVFVHDIEDGIQGTGVKAAFLKCAVDEPGLTDDIEKVVRACARASLRTGRPIMAHSHPATRRGLEIMDLLDDEGVDPALAQIAHTGDTDDLDYIEELLGRGPYIGMDRYGLDIILPTERRNATVAELCRRGYASRMMLSHDACATIDWFPRELVGQMAPNWHMGYIFEAVLPALRDDGVTDEQIAEMLEHTPARWLAASVRPLSEEDKVEILQKAGDALNRRDKATWLSFVDPEAEFRADPDWPDSEPVHGREAVWDITVSIADTWEQAPVEMVEAIDAGDDRLVARFRQPVRGRASGVETEFDYWWVGTFRQGRILGNYWFVDRERAFEAAGLSPQN